MKRHDLTAETVRQSVIYNPATGVFHWKARPREHFATELRWKTFNSQFAEAPAGTIDRHGYLSIQINGWKYQAHRLAWLYMMGEWPAKHIDHIDCNRLNNCFANLREATAAENTRNSRKQSNNTSGVKGVCWNRKHQKWCAEIMAEGKSRYLGYFDSLDAAAASYAKAARELHGDFARVE
jgi:hypothetical protein